MKKLKSIGGKSLKKGGSLKDLAKLQEEFKKKMEELESSYSEETVTASAGGGAIKVIMTCDYKVSDIEYDEDVLEDKEMFKDLLIAAFNEAIELVEKRRKEMMENLMSEMGLGGLQGLL